MKARVKWLPLALLAALAPFAAPAAEVAPQPAPQLTKDQSDFFESKVRPVLVANCYKCHSVEEKKNKGGLVLDSREGWQKGGEHGPAVVPGNPEQSLLIKAVRFEDADLKMPPNGDRLSDAQIAALEQWVRIGAPDPRTAAPGAAAKLTGLTDEARSHWAFQSVKKPDVPAVRQAEWVKTPVDAFVLARLEANGMVPSAPAPREALIRRVTYGLTGLPPTPEEVKAFVNDPSTDALEKVVDRLLASPHYGERWGRHWLDTARYSDTTGADDRRSDYRYPFAWTYRDYVINSFNADKPYDQFLKEQIAADLLPESKEDPARLAALGFLTVGKRFQNPNDTIDERIDTLTKATLGLTVACARCHDHKFDPVPTADYYSLHGVFASTVEPLEKPLLGTEPSGPEYEDFKRRLAELEAKNREIYFELVRTKSAEFRKKAGAYALATALGRRNMQSAERLKLRNELIAEFKLDRDIYQNGLRAVGRREDPVFGALMRFVELPEGQFAEKATEVLATVVRGGDRRRPINPLVSKAFADVPADSLRSLRDVADVYTKLFASIDEQARAYIHACETATTSTVDGPADAALAQLVNVPAEIVPAPALTTDKLREIAPRLPVVNGNGYQRFRLADINELMLTQRVAPPRAMVVADTPNPRNSPVFIRGEQGNRGPIVPRRFLEILSGPGRKPFTQGSGRLELANAIASPDNPLTARVLVNRVWMHHFGQGFVRTPDDLGVQSEPPGHPELLDYLVARFVEEGWSLKKLHRLILLSGVYQQSSDTKPEYATKDPENRLLWRANLRRLDFEAVRDSMLMFTGTLDRTVGGKPVNLTDEPYSSRRSVYGYIDRGSLPELLDQFDFADPDMANTKRATTIVPQQALFFMNSPMAVDVARRVTSRPEFTGAPDDAAKVAALYEVLFQRAPRPEEVAMAVEFVNASATEGAPPVATSSPTPSEGGGRNGKEAARRAARERLQKERREAMQAARMQQRRGNGRSAIRNEGERVERRPLSPWEKCAQALLFTNEMVYVN
jgi:cytochrome c553